MEGLQVKLALCLGSANEKEVWKDLEQGLEVVGVELWMCHCKMELGLELADGWLDEVLLGLEHWKVGQGLEVIGQWRWYL